MFNNFNLTDGVDVSGRLIKSEKRVEKPICDSDNSKTTTRYTRIDGSVNVKREDLIIDENTIDQDVLVKISD